MGFAQANTAVEEERIVRFTWLVGSALRGRASQSIAGTDDKRLKYVFLVQARLRISGRRCAERRCSAIRRVVLWRARLIDARDRCTQHFEIDGQGTAGDA